MADRVIFVINHGHDWWSVHPFHPSVEGTAEEMLALAKAIRERGSFAARRCAVDARDVHEYGAGTVVLWSPRNSITPNVVTRSEADQIAHDIEITVVLPEDADTEER